MNEERMPLQSGAHLHFPGLDCIIEDCIGAGSNAIAYKGFYFDSRFKELKHQVVIKELFPFDPEGRIRREKDSQSLVIDETVSDLMKFQERSFQRANQVHIRMLMDYPAELDANLNTYELNHTLYSVLAFSGGRTLDSIKETADFSARSLKTKVLRTIEILDALECFHQEELLHLDISPDNILLVGNGPRERVSIIDYNSVHSLRELREETASCYLSQKAGFSAPEVMSGRIDQIGPASDIYSVASVFYWLLTGQTRSVLEMLQGKMSGLTLIDQEDKIQETVKNQIKIIMKKGLAYSHRARYRCISDMKTDLKELIDRIDGRGITHAALWENGKSITAKMLNRNASLSYIRYEERRFPVVIDVPDQDRKSLEAFSGWLLSDQGKNCFLYGEAGIGKTSALLTLAYIQPSKYNRERASFMYLNLFDVKRADKLNLTDQILYKLRFRPDYSGMEEADHEMDQLLSEPFFNYSGKHPKLVLLLDGVNEYSGDPDELQREIDRLSAYEGIRIVASGRTFPEKMHLLPCQLQPLQEDEIIRILQGRGFQVPQSREIMEELHTPLLLSVYLQTMENGTEDMDARSADDLLGFYLKSILEKSADRYSEEGSVYWQIGIAVNYILPEIAFRMKQTGHSLSDEELLGVIGKCYRRIGSRAFRKVFPESIGHSADILDGAATAEEWYGVLVHQILWRSLGLLIREDNRTYRVFHQSMEDYLLLMRKQYGGKIEKAERTRKMLGLGTGAALVSLAVFGVIRYRTPKIYDEQQAENVLDSAYLAYAANVLQYESLNEFLDWISTQACDQDFLTSFDLQIEKEKIQDRLDTSGLVSEDTAQKMAENLQTTGKVMPWSLEPLDTEDFLELEVFPVECSEKYEELLDGLCCLMQDEENFARAGTTKEDCISLLREYLDNDRKIADCYYYRFIEPELDNFGQQDRDEYMSYAPMMQKMTETEEAEGAEEAGNAQTVDPDLLVSYQDDRSDLWRQLAYVWIEGE